jgi:MYXO-CTERM domain-containing protein
MVKTTSKIPLKFVFLAVALITASAFATTAFAASIQRVAVSPATQTKAKGTSFDVILTYNQDDGAQTTGIGFAVHYNSNILTYNSHSNFLNEGGTKVTPTDSADSSDADGDATTDKKVAMAWVDTDVQWPNTLPTNLVTLNFSVKSNAALGATPLTIFVNAPGAGQQAQVTNGTVTVVDAPAVTNVSSTKANGAYKSGEAIPVTVQFNQNVTVTGTPQLTLQTGAGTTVLNYTGMTGNDTLNFSYTVASGDTSADLDYAATNSLALNDGGITSTDTGLAAVLTLPAPGAGGSLGGNKNIIIDNTPPTYTVTAPPGAVTVNTGAFLVTGTADGTGSAVAEVQVSRDGNAAYEAAMLTPTATTADWGVNLTLGEGANPVHVRVTDAAGNVGIISAGPIITKDTTGPSVTNLTLAPQTTYYKAGNITATLTFNETMDQTVPLTVQWGGGNNVAGGWTGAATWQGTIVVAGVNGVQALTATGGKDILGNTMAAYNNTTAFTADTTEPDGGIIVPADTLSGVTAPAYTVSGTVTDAGSGVNKAEVSINNGAWAQANRNGNNWNLAVNLVQGANIILARGLDNAGNLSTSDPRTVIYQPAVTLTASGQTGTGYTVNVPKIAGSNTVPITAAGGSGAGYTWTLNPNVGTLTAGASPAQKIFTANVAALDQVVTLTVEDNQGYTPVHRAVIYLNVVSFGISNKINAIKSSASHDFNTVGGSGTVTWTASKGAINATTGLFTAPTVAVTAPAVAVTVTATDTGLGVVDTSTFNVYGAVTIQNAPAQPITVPAGSSPGIYTALGGDGVYNWTVAGPVPYTPVSNSRTFQFNAPDTGNFAGKYTVTVTDGAGSSQATFDVYVPIRLVAEDLAGNSIPPVFTAGGGGYRMRARGTAGPLTITAAETPVTAGKSVIDHNATDTDNLFNVTAENPGSAVVTVQTALDVDKKYMGSLRTQVIGTATVSGTVTGISATYIPNPATDVAVELLNAADMSPFSPAVKTFVAAAGTYQFLGVPWRSYGIRLTAVDTTVPPVYLPYMAEARIDVNAAQITKNFVMGTLTPVDQAHVLTVDMAGDYVANDVYGYTVFDATTNKAVVTAQSTADPLTITLKAGKYFLRILAKDYKPYVWTHPTTQDGEIDLSTDTDITALLVADAAFDPAARRVQFKHTKDANGFNLQFRALNFQAWPPVVNVVNAGAVVPAEGYTGTNKQGEPFRNYSYDWNLGGPETQALADRPKPGDTTHVVRFLVYDGATLVDHYTVNFTVFASATNFAAALPQAVRDLRSDYYGNEDVKFETLGKLEFYPIQGATFDVTLPDADGVEQNVTISIPPLPPDLLYVDDYYYEETQTPGTNAMGYNATKDTYTVPANPVTLTPGDKLTAHFSYYTFGGDAFASGVSLEFTMQGGAYNGATVRYNPYTAAGRRGRVANAPAITLPLFLNPESSYFKRFSQLSKAKGSIQMLVSERGDGTAKYVRETMSFTVDDTGLVLFETTHLSSFGATNVTGTTGTTDDETDDSDCLIRTVSSGDAAPALAVFGLLALLGLALLVRRRR